MTASKKKVGKYELGKTLGEGTFGKVKRAEHTETGELVAIKVLDKERIQQQNMGAQIKREVSVMKSMAKNPRVVQLREVLASKAKIYLVLELVTGGELFDEIVRDTKFTEEKARFYFRQLVEGLLFCHDKGVSHRDLKPENLLLDDNNNLKISDFGLSALYEGCGDDGMSSRAALLHTTCGTPNYVAPEVLENEGYDGFRADIWSAGVILYVLVTGCLPFDEPTLGALFQKIKTASFAMPKSLSPSLQDLLGRILVADPKSRASLNEIQQHEWLNCRAGSNVSGWNRDGRSKRSAGEQNPQGRQLQNSDSWASSSSGEGQQNKNEFQFLSSKPRPHILGEISLHLKQMCFDDICSGGRAGPAKKIKAFRTTPRGMIGLVIEVVPGEEGTLVGIRRGKGSVLEYNVLLNQLKRRLKNMIEDGFSSSDLTTRMGATTLESRTT